jgi:hypothetical protein
MASSTINNNNPRQTHVSPGIYTKETDLTYASKSLGITTLGLVGETVKGPAFQPFLIENWRQFTTYFGSTNTEKFRGSQYMKYELPYIAKSYLQQSNQLQVVRVLGLSGVNAGAAWVITAKAPEGDKTWDNMVVAVLRSRGEHKKASFLKAASPDDGICEDVYEYDKILYYAKNVTLEPSKTLVLGSECNPGYSKKTGDLTVDATNYGTFTIVVERYDGSTKKYSVTLNKNEKNYIYNVIGGDPEVGDAEVYVEELYDVALQQLVERGQIEALNVDMIHYPVVRLVPKHKPVTDILTEDESMLVRKQVGERYLYSADLSVNEENGKPLTVHVSRDNGKNWTSENGKAGHIYTVVPFTNPDGTRDYFYGEYQNQEGGEVTEGNFQTEMLKEPHTVTDEIFDDAVEVMADGLYYVLQDGDISPITLDLNNYKEQYRYASTPWIVSEMKGSAEHVELTKLFRFHTISDGNTANTEVKVSIQNIDPEKGTFDVLVRSFYDTDSSPVVLERYTQCDLIPGSKNYISLKIGSFDEQYETVSNYITVEVNETDKTKVSIPAGFMGYPIRDYQGLIVSSKKVGQPLKPFLQYNTNIDEDIKINRQYFGISDLTGIDEDILKYKGVEAYNGVPDGLSPCFHLDARILNGKPNADGIVEDENKNQQTVTVDTVNGYEWVTVGKDNTTAFGIEPRIGDEDTMANTIYEDKRYRKFTVAFYGGWDGWDYYRKSRSNSDDFRYQKYRGNINLVSGEGTNFSVLREPEKYGFDATAKCLNSDYYAYLYGIRQFANPKTIDINVFATPGIDYVNQKSLVGETIDMIENERADSVYVVTTPDKPFGAGDSESEMYTPDDVVYNLEDSDIDSNYTCSYYPNVKYFDEENNMYVYLPATKDVVRNFAYTDNVAFPWFASAGFNRGQIEGVKPKKSLKIDEQDTLYAGRMNFINTFAQDGMKIWGDKNLQIRESQMNRISKRRLLLRIRKLCSIACIGLIFDPNDNTTKQQFESAVTPILDNIMSNRGITDWRLEIDDSVEARERLELPAKIYIKPQPNLEYITIDFVITPSGTSWENI